MKIVYELNTDDMLAFTRHILENQPELKQINVFIGLMPLKIGAFLLALALVLYLIGQTTISLFVIAAAALFFILGLIIKLVLYPKMLKRAVAKDYEDQNRYVGEHSVTISRDKITDSTQIGVFSTRWEDMNYVGYDKQYLFATSKVSGFYVIPRKAFDKETDFLALVDTINKYKKEASSNS